MPACDVGNGPDNREVPFADQCMGTNNTFVNNTVFSGTGQFFGVCAQYNPGDASDHVNIDYNTYYSPRALFNDGGCAASGDIDFKQWQNAGLKQDVHTTLQDLKDAPSYADVLSAGRQMVFPP